MVITTVDAKSGEILTGPEIITRGWVYAPEAEALLDEARRAVVEAIEELSEGGAPDSEMLRKRSRQALGRFVAERTRRRPMIVPVVMEA